jgi:hypothetical protein
MRTLHDILIDCATALRVGALSIENGRESDRVLTKVNAMRALAQECDDWGAGPPQLEETVIRQAMPSTSYDPEEGIKRPMTESAMISLFAQMPLDRAIVIAADQHRRARKEDETFWHNVLVGLKRLKAKAEG